MGFELAIVIVVWLEFSCKRRGSNGTLSGGRHAPTVGLVLRARRSNLEWGHGCSSLHSTEYNGKELEKSERLRRRWSKILSKVESHLDSEKLAPFQLKSEAIPAPSALIDLCIELVSVIEFDASWEPTAKGLATEDLIDDLGRLIREIDSELDPGDPRPA